MYIRHLLYPCHSILSRTLAFYRYSFLNTLPICFNCRTLVGTASAEIAPVCAIVGGFLAQDILKTLSGKDAPLLNYFMYNGLEGIAWLFLTLSSIVAGLLLLMLLPLR